MKTAWTESPALAVQLIARFQSIKLANDVRWRLVNSPEKATGEPDALQILLGPMLPEDVSFQLKVCLPELAAGNILCLTFAVSAFLESSEPYDRCYLLSTRIWQPSVHSPICNACARKSFG